MNNRPTPETDAELNIYFRHGEAHQISVPWIEFARKLERERDDYKWQLHIAKGEIAEARKMERAWKKEETK